MEYMDCLKFNVWFVAMIAFPNPSMSTTGWYEPQGTLATLHTIVVFEIDEMLHA
jgi:hypothetical protein